MPLHLKKLGDLIDTSGIKGYLHTHMPMADPHRGYEPLHASDLTDQDREFCPREAALIMKYDGHHSVEVIDTALAYTFLLGRIIERVMRNTWLRDISIGDWECPLCGFMQDWSYYQPCPSCHHEGVVYKEVSLYWKELNTTASPDVFVLLPKAKKAQLIEIKSMDKDYFKALKAPLAEHSLRTNLYLRFLANSDFPHKDEVDLLRARVFYVAKSYGVKDERLHPSGKAPLGRGFTPFKEYIVKRDDTLTEKYVDKMKELQAYRDDGTIPDRICNMPSHKRAKYCPSKGPCFAGDIL